MISLPRGKFEHLREISWTDVKDNWRNDEENRPEWIEHYQKNGYSSWGEWRARHSEPLQAATREWHLFKIANPLQTVPTLYGGPHKSWIDRHYQGKKAITFAELANREAFQENEKVQGILGNFPDQTTVIGLHQEGRIVIIEGMHRCTALAIAAKEGREVTTNLHLAIADASGEDLPIVSALRAE